MLKSQKGFTLLEMLVAITLLAAMVAILSGGFGLSIRAWEAGEKRMEDHYGTTEAMTLIVRQLKNGKKAYTFDKKKNKKLPAFAGTPSSIVFVTNTPRLHTAGEDAGLFLQSIAFDPSGKSIVFRESYFDPRSPLEELEGLEKLDGHEKFEGLEMEMAKGTTQSLSFEYYMPNPVAEEDAEEGDEKYIWTDTVDYTLEGDEKIPDELPKAVRVRIEVENGKDEFVWPELLAPLTINAEIKKTETEKEL